ncbi:hypothetical protein [Nitrosopumilus zosterae]|nr:hypothetical protein [Nitrosopumilus zosterae]BDQ30436.1 hypothetical protein NZOSNM25_000539 [Nitrosopumilus zosterae]
MLGKAKKFGIGVGIVVLVFFVVAILASIGYEAQEEKLKTPKLSEVEIKTNALKIPYDDLLRNNENYVGEIVSYQGKVLQVQNTFGDTYVMRIGVTKNTFAYDDVVWVNYAGSRVLEGDIVEFWGDVKGIRDYTAVLGNVVSVPEVNSMILNVVQKQGS